MIESNKFFGLSKVGITQPDCLLCGSPGEKQSCLCKHCLDDLPYIDNACSSCGIPLKESHADQCGTCINNPPQNTLAVSVLHYLSPVDYLIQKMKYHNQLEIADLMANLLVNKLKTTNVDLPELIIPVPLHISRLQQRGYNQAVEIARPVSKALKIPLNLTNCIRKRLTEPQFELRHDQRQSNLKGAFEIVHQISAQHVAVIDDVMTTGSTLNELTKTLKNSGINRVDIWTCSRATLN